MYPLAITIELTFAQIVTICAVLNGLVFSLLLLDKEENRRANRFLSLMILSMCLTFTPYMLDPSVWDVYRWLAWLPFSLSYWIGPALYFYVRTLVNPGRKFRRSEYWHFVPLLLNYVHSVYHLSTGPSDPWPYFHHVAEAFEYAAIISILIYMRFCWKLLQRYQHSLLENVSTLDQIDLQWINRIIIVIVSSFVVILVFLGFSRGIFGKESISGWDDFRSGVLLIYAAILYWITINGYRQAQTIAIPPLSDDKEQETEPSEVLRNIQQVLTEEKLYRNPQLSLQDLSRAVGVGSRTISEAINQELGKNFFHYINEYRVNEMKDQLLDPQNDHLKILSLAQQAGFNSKASFNRVFKAMTGATPQAFKDKRP